MKTVDKIYLVAEHIEQNWIGSPEQRGWKNPDKNSSYATFPGMLPHDKEDLVIKQSGTHYDIWNPATEQVRSLKIIWFEDIFDKVIISKRIKDFLNEK